MLRLNPCELSCWLINKELNKVELGCFELDKIKSTFIRKRGNNYNVIVEYYDVDNKIKQKSVGKYTNKRDADKHLIDLKSSINNNNYIVAKDITLVERCQNYIHDKSKDFSPTTIESNERTLSTNIKPFFENMKLQDVTPTMLQSYANNIYATYSKDSAKRRVSFLKAVLNEAYRLKEINSNPCNHIKTPKSLVGQVHIPDVYSQEEVREVIKKIEGSIIELPILLMLTMGLRAGEVSGLCWEDIDFVNNTISINRIIISVKNKGLVFKKPKTEGSIRTISAPLELMLKLKKIKAKHNEFKLQGLLCEGFEDVVCLNTICRPYSHRNLIQTWYTFCKNNNIKKLRLHDLRHTHATMLVLGGIDFKTISNRLGHTDIKITMNRYSHVLKEMDVKASENISNIMFN